MVHIGYQLLMAAPPDVALLDASSIGDARWPKLPPPFQSDRYIRQLVSEGAEAFVANGHVRTGALRFGSCVLPILLTTNEPKTTHVCSPLSHYIAYPRSEAAKLDGHLAPAILRTAVAMAGLACRA